MIHKNAGESGPQEARDARPLVSVIIPTKNRHDQLNETLKANCLVGKLANVEFVIADNSLTPAPETMLAEWHRLYQNFVYAHHSEPTSIIGNFNFGLGEARGLYLIFIGDDDFVLPAIVDAAEYARTNSVDCVIYEPDRYYWSSCSFADRSLIGPKCLIERPGRQRHEVDPSAELKKSAENGFLTIESLPRAYHGLIAKSKMAALAREGRHAIFGGSPDISMATSLAISGATTIFWERPLSIYGASTGSGGGMTTSKTHLLPLHKATFLEAAFVETWDSSIPRYWSEYTVFPASALHVHGKLGVPPLHFNLAAVYASILVNERVMWRELLAAFSKLPASAKRRVIAGFPASIVRKLGGSLVRRFLNLSTKNLRSTEVIRRDVDHLEVLPHYSERPNANPPALD